MVNNSGHIIVYTIQCVTEISVWACALCRLCNGISVCKTKINLNTINFVQTNIMRIVFVQTIFSMIELLLLFN